MRNPFYRHIYIYIYKFGWVGFYGISTSIGYLIPNPLYIYIYIYIILALLWKLLKEAHRKKFIAENWGSADGIHIPKEKDFRKLDQFRPISLLNVEGKIFFDGIAKRMTRFVINYGYVNASIQKAGVSGFPGCIAHSTMI